MEGHFCTSDFSTYASHYLILTDVAGVGFAEVRQNHPSRYSNQYGSQSFSRCQFLTLTRSRILASNARDSRPVFKNPVDVCWPS